MQAPVIEIYKPPKLEIVNGGATWMTRDLTDADLAHVIVLAMGGFPSGILQMKPA